MFHTKKKEFEEEELTSVIELFSSKDEASIELAKVLIEENHPLRNAFISFIEKKYGWAKLCLKKPILGRNTTYYWFFATEMYVDISEDGIGEIPPHVEYCLISNDKPTYGLPPMPSGLKRLKLSGMPGLKHLPELPSGLEELSVTCDDMIELPKLPMCLKKLDISCSKIKRLALPLPSGLMEINASHCYDLTFIAEEDLPQGCECYY